MAGNLLLALLLWSSTLLGLSAAWASPKIDEYRTHDCSGEMMWTHWPSIGDCIELDYFTNSTYINTGSGFFAGVPVAYSRSGCTSDQRIGKIPGMNNTGVCLDINTMFPLPYGGRVRSIRLD
ncbi:hypothetical protein Dda_8295 [Drechslerella dactyloides]|uniref:Uncharacterized protein n=1 Tax=Drechslerella dactyloides TaxID=74499 RepID=A0AAD6IS57_DREDA|nr:hypothetical protein Dda_8295 [Drechslerella dactyloides]